jgi:hypothetical protein
MTLSEQSLFFVYLSISPPQSTPKRVPLILKLLKKTVAIQSQGGRKRQTEMRCGSNKENNKIMLLAVNPPLQWGVSN